MTDDKLKPWDYLRPEYQQQADFDGIMVTVSRQAIDETLAMIDATDTQVSSLVSALEPFAEAMQWVADDYDEDYTPDWSPFLPVSVYRQARAALDGINKDQK